MQVLLQTNLGDITLRLYDETPQHRDNFLRLVREGYYNGTLFHKRGALAAARQGDEVNPERRSSGSQFYIVWGQTYNDGQLRQMGKQLEMQRLQSIFQTLAADHRAEILQLRRDRNRTGLQELQDRLVAEAETKAKTPGPVLTEAQMEAYSSVGGTPHLDGQYTVFGEVVEGLDIVDRIQQVETLSGDRPKADVVVVKANVLEG